MNILTLDLLDGKPRVSVAVASQAEAERLSSFMRRSTQLWDNATETTATEVIETWYYPWEEAPDWATWAATDEDGEMYWYEAEPAQDTYSNAFAVGKGFWVQRLDQKSVKLTQWKTSKQRRAE